MAIVYNYAAKKWEDSPDNVAQQQIAAGTHGLPSGIDVPVVGPDGTHGTVKSDEFRAAMLEGGFRLPTGQDMLTQEQQAATQARQQLLDQPGAALAQGIVGGATFGLGNLAVRKIAGAMGGNENDIQGLQQGIKEESPIASGVGEIAGTLINPLTRTGIGQAGEAATAATGLTEGLAGRIVQSAGEGAYLGLNSGMSEAALGDPNHIAENIVGGVTNGVLTGGALPIVMKGAGIIGKPILDFTKNSVSKVADLVGGAARQVAKSTMVPALLEKDAAKYAALGQDLTAQDAARLEWFGGKGKEAFQSAAADSEKAASELEASSKATQDELVRQLKREPEQVASDVSQLVDNNRGNLYKASLDAYNDLNSTKEMFNDVLAQSQNEAGQISPTLYKDTLKHIETLAASGDSKAISESKRVANVLNSYMSPEQLKAGAIQLLRKAGADTTKITDTELSSVIRKNIDEIVSNGISKADEMQMGDRLRNVTNDISGLSNEAQKEVNKYQQSVTDAMQNHPDANIAEMQKGIDRYSNAYNKLADFIGSADNKSLDSTQQLLKKLSLPEHAEELDKLLNNLGEFSPQMKQAADIMGGARTNLSKLKEFESTMNNMLRDKDFKSMTGEDFAKVARYLQGNDPEKFQKMLSGTMEQAGALDSINKLSNPVEKLVALKKAAGHDITEDMQRLASMNPEFEKLHQLSQTQSSQSRAGDSLLGGRGPSRSLMAYMIGGPKLAVGLRMLSKVKEGINPYSALQMLTNVEQAANKGAKVINKAIDMSVKAITSPTAQRATQLILSKQPLAERRDSFKQRSQMLSQFTTPDSALRLSQQMVGEMGHAPMVYGALTGKVAQIGQFLATKMPKDPLAASNVLGTSSQWQPSDSDLAKFERYYEAAQNPASTIKRVADGSVTQEEMETLQTIYPNIYNRLQSQVMDAIVNRGEEMAYQQKLKLSQMFNMPTDYSLSAPFVSTMQTNFIPPGQQQAAPGEEPKRRPGRPSTLDSDLAKAEMTDTQKVSYT